MWIEIHILLFTKCGCRYIVNFTTFCGRMWIGRNIIHHGMVVNIRVDRCSSSNIVCKLVSEFSLENCIWAWFHFQVRNQFTELGPKSCLPTVRRHGLRHQLGNTFGTENKGRKRDHIGSIMAMASEFVAGKQCGLGRICLWLGRDGTRG